MNRKMPLCSGRSCMVSIFMPKAVCLLEKKISRVDRGVNISTFSCKFLLHQIYTQISAAASCRQEAARLVGRQLNPLGKFAPYRIVRCFNALTHGRFCVGLLQSRKYVCTKPADPAVQTMSSRLRKSVFVGCWLFLVSLLLLRSYTAVFDAEVNFDFFMYLGVVHQFFGDASISGLDFIHQTVQKEMPWYDVQANVIAQPYRNEIWTNPDAFNKQIPYYSIKPIYPVLMQGLHMTGLEYLQASILISALAYVGMIGLAWLCVRHGLPSYSISAVLAVLALSFYQPIYTFARFSTPDMLNAFVVVLSAYAAFRLDRWRLAFGIGFLAIYIRPDSILWTGALWVAYVDIKGINFRNMAMAGLAVIAGLAVYYSIRLIDEPYSVFLLQKVFFSPLDAASAHPDRVIDIYNLSEIAARYRDATLGLLQEKFGSTHYLWMIALSVTGISMSFRLSLPAERVWFIAPLAAMVVFHLVMPKEHDRNLLYAYMVILIGWARLVCHAPKPSAP